MLSPTSPTSDKKLNGQEYSYYTSRTELLNWVNGVLDLQLTRLEQFASGALYCQLLDAYFHQIILMHKVNFYAREEYECIVNYKVLQAGFNALNITREIDISRLSRASTVDNLELLQWLYRYLRKRQPVVNYEPRERRAMSVRGGTENLPVPVQIASFDIYGRAEGPAALKASGGHWSMLLEGSGPRRSYSAFQTPRKSGRASGYSSRPDSASRSRDLDAMSLASGYSESRRETSIACVQTDFSDYPTNELTPEGRVDRWCDSTTTHDTGTGTDYVDFEEKLARSASVRTSPSNAEALGVEPFLDRSVTASMATPSTPVTLVISTNTVVESAEIGTSPLASPISSRNAVPEPPEQNKLITLVIDAGVSNRSSRELPQLDVEPAVQNKLITLVINSSAVDTASKDTPKIATASTATETTPQPSPRSIAAVISPRPNGLPSYSAAGALTSSVETAVQAISVLQHSIPSLRKLVEMMGSDQDSYIYRGKLRSLRDAVQTLMRHSSLLLGDLQTHCIQKNDAECARSMEDVNKLQQTMIEMEAEFAELAAFVDLHENAVANSPAKPQLGSPQVAKLTDEQKQMSSTQPLDTTLKAVSSAQFALVQHIHRESTAMTAQYLGSGAEAQGKLAAGATPDSSSSQASTSGRAAKSISSTRVFKLGDFQLKRLRNGDIYKGKYIHNKKNGEGVYQFINQDVYEGEFKDDRMDGYGVYTFSHEGRYEGEWHNAVYEGAGTETFAKGSTYHGEYSSGLRNGWGVCRFYNGDYYEGQWLKGLRDGRGMQQCTDDSNYVGDYVKGKRHGYGVYSFPNGDRYVGEYSEDLPHGHGVYMFTSGQRYEGEWLRGKKHGWSVYTIENGNKFVGQWHEGKPQWVQPLMGDVASPDQLPEGIDAKIKETLQQAFTAHKKATEASDIANMRAVEQWNLQDCIQRSIRDAVARAELAAKRAQAARQKARELAAKLDSAVALLEDSSKSTDVTVVTE